MISDWQRPRCWRSCWPPAALANSPAASTSSSFKLQSEYVKLVHDVGPSVVLIETSVGLGSGIIYDAQGDIVTNNHVVTGSQTFMVITSTGKQYPASLIGAYPPDDLAVIRIQATGLHPATFANYANLQVGDIITAIGGQSVTGAQAVADVLLSLKPGLQVTVNLLHSDGSKGAVSVTLTELQ